MPRPRQQHNKDYVPFEFDINKMPRSRKAWEAAISLLNDGQWHHYCELLQVMLEVSDIQPSSCVGLLGQMLKQSLIDMSEDKRWYCRKLIKAPIPKIPSPLSRNTLDVYNYQERVRPTLTEDLSVYDTLGEGL